MCNSKGEKKRKREEGPAAWHTGNQMKGYDKYVKYWRDHEMRIRRSFIQASRSLKMAPIDKLYTIYY